jgi:hypothetical protein
MLVWFLVKGRSRREDVGLLFWKFWSKAVDVDLGWMVLGAVSPQEEKKLKEGEIFTWGKEKGSQETRINLVNTQEARANLMYILKRILW